jgi:hypothetical protein
MDNDPKTECGDSRVWGRPDDLFDEACTFHDYHYQRKHALSTGDHVEQDGATFVLWTRKDVDKAFLEMMLAKAQTLRDRLQAYAYYGIVRAVGWHWWNRDGKGSPVIKA